MDFPNSPDHRSDENSQRSSPCCVTSVRESGHQAGCTLGKRLCRYRLFWIVFLVILILDQSTKIYIKEFSGLWLGEYPPHGGWELIPGFFSIVYNVNTGAAWGMFSGFGLVLAGLAVLALVTVYYFRAHLQIARKTMQVTFGMMTAGIAGNLIDRLAYGFVVDFLDFHLGFYRWPTFNIADSAIFVSVALYTFISLREDIRKGR